MMPLDHFRHNSFVNVGRSVNGCPLSINWKVQHSMSCYTELAFAALNVQKIISMYASCKFRRSLKYFQMTKLGRNFSKQPPPDFFQTNLTSQIFHLQSSFYMYDYKHSKCAWCIMVWGNRISNQTHPSINVNWSPYK